MDLGLYATVVRRHLVIFVIGAVLSLAAAYAVFTMSSPSFLNRSTLSVTQAGFPWGRSTLDENVPVKGDPRLTVPRFADPTRMEYLATVYAKFASGDAVVSAATRGGVAPDYQVDVLLSPEGTSLPLLQVTGFGATPAEATAVTNRVTDAFQTYITRRQSGARIEPESRIQLQEVSRARLKEAETAVGRRPARPVMTFLLGMMLTVGAVFLVDNLRGGRRSRAAVPVNASQPEQATPLPAPHVMEPRPHVPTRPNPSPLGVPSRPQRSTLAADESAEVRTLEAGGRGS